MKEYKGKAKALSGLGTAIVILGATMFGILVIWGLKWSTALIAAFIAFIISFLYKGMVIRITVDKDKIQVYKPLSKKSIKFSNIAFCMVHGIDETDSIIYAFVKKKIGKTRSVKGIKQNLPFEEVVKIINQSNENIDLDINFNMAEKIPVSLVENSEELKSEILNTLGGYQKKILNSSQQV